MARITNWLSTWHAFLTALPQNGYHNLSRVVQPQMRSICESFQAKSLRSKADIQMQTFKSRSKNAASRNVQGTATFR
jgi:hypothetical protein